MNRLLGFGVMLALAACGSEGGDKGKAEASQAAPLNTIDRSHAGTPAPSTPFEIQPDKPETLASYRGKRVLVNLWATWCAPCVAEMPALDRLAAAKAGKLVVLPISQDMEGWKPVGKFWARGGFKTIQPRLDQPGAMAEAVKARGLPLSILYDEQGREVWRVAGTVNWGSATVMAAL